MNDFGFSTIGGVSVSLMSLLIIDDFQLFMFLVITFIMAGILFSNREMTKRKTFTNIFVISLLVIMGTIYFQANYFIGLSIGFIFGAKPYLIEEIMQSYVKRIKGEKK